ncbi:hypothetical protein KR200_003890, partial [Drosophila serrata]
YPLTVTRLSRELSKIVRNPPEGCKIRITNNMFQWLALIDGPAKTPYYGGLFKILLDFPPNYPFSPPTVRFLNKIFHSNVGTDGSICHLDNIWVPVQTVESILKALVMLLIMPIPEDPMNPLAAVMYICNRFQHDYIACMWTCRFANAD